MPKLVLFKPNVQYSDEGYSDIMGYKYSKSASGGPGAVRFESLVTVGIVLPGWCPERMKVSNLRSMFSLPFKISALTARACVAYF